MKQTKAIKTLRGDVRIAMTGTPIENRLSDLWSIFDFLNAGLLGSPKEFKAFTARLKDAPDGYAKLRGTVSPFILRRLKTDKAVISDLPEKNETKQFTTLSKKQVALYNALVKELDAVFNAPESLSGIERKGKILAAIVKFKQICNHPDQYSGQAGFEPKHSGKFATLAEICTTIMEKHESVLVFTQFREMCEPLSRYLHQLDRFARNRYDSATYKAKLKKNGVRVLSARENISDDASGVLMEAVLEGMAEYYSVELAEKITRGMAINVEKCLSNGGGLSLGYSVDKDKRFIINEDEAAIVRRIYEMYTGGFAVADIIRYLNNHSLRTILINRRYIGYYIHKGGEIPDGMPRIIDDETFAKAQEIMAKNKKAPARAKAIEENYLLTTKLFCGECKAALTGVSGTSHTGAFHQYYQCAGNRRNNGCKKKTMKKAYLEDMVIVNTIGFLIPATIDMLARSIEEQCERERNTDDLKRVNKLIRGNETATANRWWMSL